MAERDYYLFSNDLFDYCPVPEELDEPVTFVSIANHAALHALSFLQDRAEVERCIFFDAQSKQLTHHQRMWGLLAKHTDRTAYLEELLGVKFHEFTQDGRPSWMRADYDNFEATTGLTFEKVVGPDHLTVQGGEQLCLSPFQGDTVLWAGWGLGYLCEGFFPMTLPPALHVLGKASEVIPWCFKAHPHAATVIWLSNILGDAHLKQDDGLTAELVKSWDGWPDAYLWTDSRIEGTTQKMRAKPADWSPHPPIVYETKAVRRCLQDEGDVLELTPEDLDLGQSENLASGRCSTYANYLLGNTGKYQTIVLHKLFGYGVAEDDFLRVVAKARENKHKLVVAEHFQHSLDPFDYPGSTPAKIRELVGQAEEALYWCRGKECRRRCFVMNFSDLDPLSEEPEEPEESYLLVGEGG